MRIKKINLLIFGASGKMGQALLELIKNDTQFVPYIAISENSNKISEFQFTFNLKNIEQQYIKNVDICIDFTQPQAFSEILQFCKKNKLALVTGTTGLKKEDFNKIKLVSKSIPILWSSNMSLGVIVLKKLIRELKIIKNFDFQIEEFHHNKKKDNPSGTALTLQMELDKSTNKINPKPIGIRGGGIFGIHKIHAMSEEEIITIEHTALNRKVFARGALMSALWLKKQKPGIYSIDDIFKIN